MVCGSFRLWQLSGIPSLQFNESPCTKKETHNLSFPNDTILGLLSENEKVNKNKNSKITYDLGKTPVGLMVIVQVSWHWKT